MFFQGRGNTYLRERNADGTLGPAQKICQDALSISLATESGEHINKCGAVDAPDDRYQKSVSGTVTLSFATVEDKKFAIGVLGTINPAAVSPTAVVDEEIAEAEAGASAFLGGANRNRNITSLTIEDSATVPATLALNTNYTVDAESGRIDWVDVTGFTFPLLASYSHQSPQTVSLLTAPQKEYVLDFENINKRNSNDAGSLENREEAADALA